VRRKAYDCRCENSQIRSNWLSRKMWPPIGPLRTHLLHCPRNLRARFFGPSSPACSSSRGYLSRLCPLLEARMRISRTSGLMRLQPHLGPAAGARLTLEPKPFSHPRSATSFTPPRPDPAAVEMLGWRFWRPASLPSTGPSTVAHRADQLPRPGFRQNHRRPANAPA